jgi:hypothetical protein
MTRLEAARHAAHSKKVPKGISTTQVQLWLPDALIPVCRNFKASERGALWSIGYSIQQDGYLFLYKIIAAMGGQIINTSMDGGIVTIVTATRKYVGTSHFDLLVEIIDDLTKSED